MKLYTYRGIENAGLKFHNFDNKTKLTNNFFMKMNTNTKILNYT